MNYHKKKKTKTSLFIFLFFVTLGMNWEAKAEKLLRESLDLNPASEKRAVSAIAPSFSLKITRNPSDRTGDRLSRYSPFLQAQIDRPNLPSQEPLPEESIPLPSPSELLDLQPLIPANQDNPSIPGTIVINRFEVRGSTVFSSEDFAELTKDYIDRPISFQELLQVRFLINEEYRKRDYITSGAFIPQQEMTDGTITIQIIEGEIEEINITGLRRLNPGYIRSRLQLFTQKPVNIKRLQEGLY
ncbi:MAG: POTRA domain-containing protein, partial [Cyanobacteria bacterium P01_E01_bin.42]